MRKASIAIEYASDAVTDVSKSFIPAFVGSNGNSNLFHSFNTSSRSGIIVYPIVYGIIYSFLGTLAFTIFLIASSKLISSLRGFSSFFLVAFPFVFVFVFVVFIFSPKIHGNFPMILLIKLFNSRKANIISRTSFSIDSKSFDSSSKYVASILEVYLNRFMLLSSSRKNTECIHSFLLQATVFNCSYILMNSLVANSSLLIF